MDAGLLRAAGWCLNQAEPLELPRFLRFCLGELAFSSCCSRRSLGSVFQNFFTSCSVDVFCMPVLSSSRIIVATLTLRFNGKSFVIADSGHLALKSVFSKLRA